MFNKLSYVKVLIKGSSKMISLGLLSQIIILLVTLFLTNYLTPASFGLFGVYIALWSITSVILSGKYELSLLEASDGLQRINILFLCFITLITSSVFIFFIALASFIVFNIPSFWLFILVSSIFSSVIGIFKILQASDRIFVTYQTSLVLNAIFFSLSAFLIVFYYSEYSNIALIIAHSFGLFASFVAACFINKKTIIIMLNKKLNLNEIRLLAIKNKQFPAKALPSELIMLIPQSIVIFVNHFLGSSIAGFYTLCQRVILTPFLFFGLGFSEYIRSDISAKRRIGKNITSELNLYILVIIVTGIIVIISSYFIFPILINELLPRNYSALENYLKILSFGLAAQAGVLFTSHLWQISENKKFGLLLLSISQTFPIIIFILSNLQGSIESDELLLRLSLSMLILSILPVYYLRNAFRKN